MRKGLQVYVLFILLCAPVFAAKTVTIGIITDSPTQQALLPLPLLQAEMNALMADEFTLEMPENKRMSADGTLNGVRTIIQQQLADPQIELIITLGLVSSQEIAKIPTLNKPVIAAFVLDRRIRRFPLFTLAPVANLI